MEEKAEMREIVQSAPACEHIIGRREHAHAYKHGTSIKHTTDQR